ncbi:MAG: TetR/AcrR family transcriptional regulator [Chromatiales bacterium]|nr:TetR/AcrR family transcriptional regulator [Chromatiales bacterium]
MGRPIEFNPEEVLENAMRAFWEQGYCATSMADLTSATNLKPGSLYAAFKSKQGLLLAALDHYGQRSRERLQQTLTEAASPLAGIRSYFQQLTEVNPATNQSCFLVNTVLELARKDEAIRSHINRHFDEIELLFREALHNAQQAGELSAEKDPDALAAFLMSNIWGLRVLLGTAPSKQRLKSVVDQLLEQLK